jgi:NADPH:quinone reductase-like Zn-dependent oxidoreductase
MCTPRWITGRADWTRSIGNQDDGVLQDYVIVEQDGLFALPSNHDFVQGSTLACAALTAWNALYGLKSKAIMPGDWVLTEGTGGVSLFAVQASQQIIILLVEGQGN